MATRRSKKKESYKEKEMRRVVSDVIYAFAIWICAISILGLIGALIFKLIK